jgi:hypothetical protein
MNASEAALAIAMRYKSWAGVPGNPRAPQVMAVEYVGEAGPYKVYIVELDLRDGSGPKTVVGEIGPGSGWMLAYRGFALPIALLQAQLRLEKIQRRIAKNKSASYDAKVLDT